MLIPLGHEGQTVRRLPWVTFALIALNVAMFLAVGRTAGDAELRIARAYEAARTYWFAHPYLELRPDLSAAMAREIGPERFETLAAAMNSSLHPPPEDAEVRAQEQQELDTLTDEWSAADAAHPYGRWGLVPSRFDAIALLTCMFMHAGWLHLLGNMFILYLAAPAVEDAWGRPLFATVYLVSGLIASLLHVALHPLSDVPLVGASGAIAGVMGAFMVRFARTKIKFFYWFGFVFRGTFDAPAWLMLPLWLLEQLWMGSLSKGGDGVAYWAHVGGFAFGGAVALAMRAARIEERFIHPRIEAAISISSHPAIERGMELIAGQSFDAAREAFAEALAANPRDPEAHLGMWESYRAEGNAAAGAEHMSRVLEHDLKSGELGLALERWRELSMSGASAPAALRFRLGAALADSEQTLSAREVFGQLADDPAAGLLGAKAVAMLAELATDAAERARLQAEAKRRSEAAPAAPTPAASATAPPRSRPLAPATRAATVAGPTAPAVPTATSRRPADSAGGAPAIDRRVLRRLHPAGLLVASAAGEEVVRYDQLSGVVVAGIADGARPYVVTDLLLRTGEPDAPRVVRLLSSEFDPRTVMERPDLAPLAAFRALVGLIARAGGVTVRPEPRFEAGEKLPTYASLAEYERAVLISGS